LRVLQRVDDAAVEVADEDEDRVRHGRGGE